MCGLLSFLSSGCALRNASGHHSECRQPNLTFCTSKLRQCGTAEVVLRSTDCMPRSCQRTRVPTLLASRLKKWHFQGFQKLRKKTEKYNKLQQASSPTSTTKNLKQTEHLAKWSYVWAPCSGSQLLRQAVHQACIAELSWYGQAKIQTVRTPKSEPASPWLCRRTSHLMCLHNRGQRWSWNQKPHATCEPHSPKLPYGVSRCKYHKQIYTQYKDYPTAS